MKEEYKQIILEALKDYAQWFTNQVGTDEELVEDEKKIRLINAAYLYVCSL